jgi:hypothetical protein
LAEQQDAPRPHANPWQAKGIELESQVTSQQNARPISLFEKREELRRVLESRNFARAPKKTRFLEFVSEQTFLGNGDNLNEYLIGVEVYGRGATFNAQEDPIVRVQAHEIRRLLKQYYEEEGKDSLIRLELPAGHYVPSFARSAVERSVVEEVAEEAAPPEPPLPLPGLRKTVPAALHLGLTLALAAACVVLAFFLATRVRPSAQTQPAAVSLPGAAVSLPDDLGWFWRPFLPPASGPVIVIPNHPLLRAAHDGDSAQTLAGGHEIPKASLPEFRDTIHYRELKRFLFVPSLTDFTSVGETLGVVRLCNMFYSVGEKCNVQQSRLVNFDEIKGENAILLGGSQAWSGRVFLNVEGFHLQSGVILNRNPQPGEKPAYRPEFDPVTNQLTRDYALVLMLPNEKKEDRVLLIYGIYTQGSQAAIEFLTNPEQMRELRKALLALAPDHKTMPLYFQALLETSVENSVPGTSSLVALRVISN